MLGVGAPRRGKVVHRSQACWSCPGHGAGHDSRSGRTSRASRGCTTTRLHSTHCSGRVGRSGARRADRSLLLCDVAVPCGGRSGSLGLFSCAVCVVEVLTDRLGDVGVALVRFGCGLVRARGALCSVRGALAGSLDPLPGVVVHTVWLPAAAGIDADAVSALTADAVPSAGPGRTGRRCRVGARARQPARAAVRARHHGPQPSPARPSSARRRLSTRATTRSGICAAITSATLRAKAFVAGKVTGVFNGT